MGCQGRTRWARRVPRSGQQSLPPHLRPRPAALGDQRCVQPSQVPDLGRDVRGPITGNVLGAAVGQQLGSTAAEVIRRGMTVAPTLEIRPGYPLPRGGHAGHHLPGFLQGGKSGMKLKPVRTLSPVMLKGRVPGDLYEALVAYAAYYRGVHGEAIELWALLLQILSTFLDADREFHTWRRHPRRSGGAGMESRNG